MKTTINLTIHTPSKKAANGGKRKILRTSDDRRGGVLVEVANQTGADMSMETKAKHSPAYLRKRFDRMLERIAEYGDLVGNEGEICWLRNLCEEMFEELYAPARCRVLDSISKQLREAAAEYRRENSGG